MSKQKQIAKRWLGGFVLLCLIVWFMAITKSIEVYSETIKLEDKVAGFTEFQDSRQKENLVGLQQNKQVQQILFATVNELCMQNNVELIETGAPHQHQRNNLELSTFTLHLTGSFKDLLKTLHALELNFNEGQVKGYQFSKQKNRKTKKEYLQLSIWVQSIKPLKN